MEGVFLESDRLRIVVDAGTGALRDVVHKGADLSLIAEPEIASRHPFMIVLQDGSVRRPSANALLNLSGEAGEMTLRWGLDEALELTVRLRLQDESGELHCSMTLDNPTDVPVAAVAYPYIAGIGRLGGDREGDELVHPYATGFLVRNPLDHLPPVSSETESQGTRPVALGLYPEGFSGSAMQFMAYSARGRGGFYVATEDSAGMEKWLNFYRHPDGDLRMAVWHGPDSYASRRRIAPAYVTILAALDGGSWYDAADRYARWALGRPWTAQGALWSRGDRCRRLLEEVGLCTFGINPRYNRAPWLQEIDRIAGAPALHILGPNWSRIESNYMNSHPGGVADWFPATFHPENLAVVRRNGDLFAPFLFDLLLGRGEGCTDVEAGTKALQLIPRPTLSRDAYDFPFLCPATQFLQDLHAARGRTLAEEYGVGGVYYDISVNNVRHICLASTHDHDPGETRAMTESYRHLYGVTWAGMRAAAGGASVPQGTEMINEQMLPFLDFYQARAEASPAAPFEAGPFRELIKAGQAEKIPLFAYVYHEYGPMRLDGWAKLSREQGDFVYFVLGRVFVQGGLIELNYEFSALEDLGDARDTAAEHYYEFDDRHYAIDPELASFVGRLSRARVGPANRYLAYGAMQRPAPLEVEGEAMLELEYFLYNCGRTMTEYEDRGTVRVPAVLQCAWRYRQEGFAWILLNLSTEERRARLTLTPPAYGDAPSSRSALTRHEDPRPPEPLGVLDGARTLSLVLPPRVPVMVEALPLSGKARS